VSEYEHKDTPESFWERMKMIHGDDVGPVVNSQDLVIDTYRPAGIGAHLPYSAIRITHKPTGIVVIQDGERSQLQNRELAIKQLRHKLAMLEYVKRGVEAVQEEFDERGWGDATLLVETILEESGYPDEIERLWAMLDHGDV
jgi:protein subunit release factor B